MRQEKLQRCLKGEEIDHHDQSRPSKTNKLHFQRELNPDPHAPNLPEFAMSYNRSTFRISEKFEKSVHFGHVHS